MFNATLQVIEKQVTAPEEGDRLEVTLILGIPMQMGPGQVGFVPSGAVKFMLTEQSDAIEFADTIKELAANLPKASSLEVASNISDVEKAAERLERIKNGGQG